jgi:hypothetical protein
MCRRDQIYFLAVFRDRLDSESNGGVREIGDHVDAIDIKPFSGNGGANIRLVLMVTADDLDRLAEDGRSKIFNRHFGGFKRTSSRNIRERTAHVAKNADLHWAIGSGMD